MKRNLTDRETADRPTVYFVDGDDEMVGFDIPSIKSLGLPQHLDALVEVLDGLDVSLQKLEATLAPVLKATDPPPTPSKDDRQAVTPLSDRVDLMVAHAHDLVAFVRHLTARVYL